MGKHTAPGDLTVAVEDILMAGYEGWKLPPIPVFVTPDQAERVLRHVLGDVHPPFLGEGYEHFLSALRHAADRFEVEGWEI